MRYLEHGSKFRTAVFRDPIETPLSPPSVRAGDEYANALIVAGEAPAVTYVYTQWSQGNAVFAERAFRVRRCGEMKEANVHEG